MQLIDLSQIKNLLHRIQGSSLFNQFSDRYQNLSPSTQKIVMIATALFSLLLVLSIPYSFLSSSSDYIQSFQDKRQTIRQLLESTKEANNVPQIAPSPDTITLKNMIENGLRFLNLLPTQMGSVQAIEAKSEIIPSRLLQGATQITLFKLNQQQLVDAAYKLQTLHPSVKLKDMNITESSEEKKYFDVVFTLISLAIPQQIETPAEEPSARSQKNKKDQE